MRSEGRRLMNRLREIADRPGMFLSNPSYDGLCSFIEGFDYACEGKVLAAFRKWLVEQNAPTNLGWSSGFLYSLFASDEDPIARIKKSSADDKLAINKLVEAFGKVLERESD